MRMMMLEFLLFLIRFFCAAGILLLLIIGLLLLATGNLGCFFIGFLLILLSGFIFLKSFDYYFEVYKNECVVFDYRRNIVLRFKIWR